MKNIWDYTEVASEESIELTQEAKLKCLVSELKKSVPFYKENLQQIEASDCNLSKLETLPFTTKQDLRDNYPLGMLATDMKKVVRLHGSSGTTGNQTFVAYTKNDLDVWSTLVARSLTAIGVTSEDKMQISFGYGMFTGGLGIHGGAEKVGATVIPASAGNTLKQLTFMKDLETSVICCTPSYALYLSDALKEQGLTSADLKLKVGLFGAEPWSNEIREELEMSLGIQAFDIYGLSEIMGPGVAYGCQEKEGLHINEDHFIAEIIDPLTGCRLPDGQEGELVITTLSKEAFPLLRYRTGDITRLIPEKCSCGRTFKRMAKPTGRVDDMLIVKGVNLYPSQIEALLLSNTNCLPHYQLELRTVNHMDELSIKVESRLINERDVVKLEKDLNSLFKTEIGLSLPVKVLKEQTLERFEGKATRVIDNRKDD